MGKRVFEIKEIEDIIFKYKTEMLSVKEISKIYKCDSSIIKNILLGNKIEIISGSPFSVDYWLKRGMSLERAKLKIKIIKPSLIEYWIEKGFNYEDSKLKTELHLMNTERAFIIKFGELEGKKKYSEKKEKEGKFNSTRRVEYWMKKGFNENESKKIIEEKQNTFSLKKCLEKYGVEEGKEIFLKRQRKWQNTLKSKLNYDEIQKLKDSKSLNSILQKNPNNFVEAYFKFNLHNKIFNFLIESVQEKNYEKFLYVIKTNFDYDRRKITAISKVKLFQFLFEKNQDDIIKDVNKLYNVRSKQSFGTTFMTEDGIIVRSFGEKIIFEKLKEFNIDFLYDKFYPNQKKLKYDFYLPKQKIYIEYFGMLNVKETKNNKKIIDEYKRKIKEKLELCTKNNYIFLFTNKPEEILNYLKKIAE